MEGGEKMNLYLGNVYDDNFNSELRGGCSLNICPIDNTSCSANFCLVNGESCSGHSCIVNKK